MKVNLAVRDNSFFGYHLLGEVDLGEEVKNYPDAIKYNQKIWILDHSVSSCEGRGEPIYLEPREICEASGPILTQMDAFRAECQRKGIELKGKNQ